MNADRLNVVINVEDFETVTTFYRDVLGLAEEASWDGPEGPGMVLRAGDGRTVEFFGPPWGARTDPRPSQGIELAFEVSDADAWHERLMDHDVPIAREMIDNPWGDRSFGIDDPAGMRVWILQQT